MSVSQRACSGGHQPVPRHGTGQPVEQRQQGGRVLDVGVVAQPLEHQRIGHQRPGGARAATSGRAPRPPARPGPGRRPACPSMSGAPTAKAAWSSARRQPPSDGTTAPSASGPSSGTSPARPATFRARSAASSRVGEEPRGGRAAISAALPSSSGRPADLDAEPGRRRTGARRTSRCRGPAPRRRPANGRARPAEGSRFDEPGRPRPPVPRTSNDARAGAERPWPGRSGTTQAPGPVVGQQGAQPVPHRAGGAEAMEEQQRRAAPAPPRRTKSSSSMAKAPILPHRAGPGGQNALLVDDAPCASRSWTPTPTSAVFPTTCWPSCGRVSPVVWLEEPPVDSWPAGPGGWVVLRHADVKAVLRQPDGCSPPSSAPHRSATRPPPRRWPSCGG